MKRFLFLRRYADTPIRRYMFCALLAVVGLALDVCAQNTGRPVPLRMVGTVNEGDVIVAGDDAGRTVKSSGSTNVPGYMAILSVATQNFYTVSGRVDVVRTDLLSVSGLVTTLRADLMTDSSRVSVVRTDLGTVSNRVTTLEGTSGLAAMTALVAVSNQLLAADLVVSNWARAFTVAVSSQVAVVRADLGTESSRVSVVRTDLMTVSNRVTVQEALVATGKVTQAVFNAFTNAETLAIVAARGNTMTTVEVSVVTGRNLNDDHSRALTLRGADSGNAGEPGGNVLIRLGKNNTGNGNDGEFRLRDADSNTVVHVPIGGAQRVLYGSWLVQTAAVNVLTVSNTNVLSLLTGVSGLVAVVRTDLGTESSRVSVVRTDLLSVSGLLTTVRADLMTDSSRVSVVRTDLGTVSSRVTVVEGMTNSWATDTELVAISNRVLAATNTLNAAAFSGDTNLRRYMAGGTALNNVYVLASRTGVVASIGASLISLSVPSGCQVVSSQVRWDGASLGSSFAFDVGTVDMENTSITNRWAPVWSAWWLTNGLPAGGTRVDLDTTNLTRVLVTGITNAGNTLVEMRW